jgi:Mg-chelatase subunit ChlD
MTQATRTERWRLILGSDSADSTGCTLQGNWAKMDDCLGALYNPTAQSKRGGLGASSPNVARWLGDIRQYFPSSVVRVMQQDAIEKLNLRALLLEPEILENIEADVHMVSTLISLKDMIPERTKDSARQVVAKVVQELLQRLQQPTQQAISGALNRAIRNRRPRLKEIDWHRTIRANIKNYLPEYKTIVPDTLIGYGRKRMALRDVILCIDQSGSMAPSVVYSSIFAAVMASMPALKTQMVIFDTAIIDLTEELHDDPVDLLFGLQLGGGTDINRAIGYCQGLITRPQDTLFFLISDLCEGGDSNSMLKRVTQMVSAGVQVIALLALSDEGAPYYDHDMAEHFAALGIPTFACTPDQFPDLMAHALAKQDLHAWAAQANIVLQRQKG